MPYPAENTISNNSMLCGYSLNGVHHNIGSYVSRRRYTVHPASGAATRIKGFRLCRGWSHTYGEMSVSCPGGAGATYVQPPFVNDKYVYDSGLQAWLASGSVSLPGLPSLPGGNMINATLVAALNKLKDQDIHVGNFIAESDKTLAMFADAAKRIASSVRAFRKKDPSAWLEVTKVQTGRLARENWCKIPSAWLELQYGWNPLVNDVWGAIHHLVRKNRYTVPYIFVKSNKRSSSTVQVSYVPTGGPADYFATNPGDNPSNLATFEDTQNVWVQLVYGVTTPQLAELSSLGLLNPAEMVWEVLPYSFVVDWFLPIGSWLSALTGAVGFSFVTGSRSSKSERVFKGVSRKGVWRASTFIGSTQVKNDWPNDLSFNGKFGVFERVCYTSSPVPGLYVKNPLSYDHVANGLSLLSQAFARR